MAAIRSGMPAEALAAAREGLQLLEAQGRREPYHEALCSRIAALALCTQGLDTRKPAGEVVRLLNRSKRAEAAAAVWLPPMLRRRLSQVALTPRDEQQLRRAAARGETLPGDAWAAPSPAERDDAAAGAAALLASVLRGDESVASLLASVLGDTGGGAGALPPDSVAGLMQMPMGASSPAGTQAPPMPPTASEPAGMAFLQERLASCVAIPPAQRSPDVAGFVAGYRLIDEVAAALPSLEAVEAGAPAVPRDAVDLALLKQVVA